MIEELYCCPIADLEARAEASPQPGMLVALVATRAEVQQAEANIAHQLRRLRDLSASARHPLELSDAAHLADCVRRLSDSLVARDAGVRVLTRVLQSLHRAPEARPTSTASAPPFSPPSAPNTASPTPR
ncbi:hypothetical protein ACL02R_11510 [Streptomyces sp. MS19]|uniref:hypothetical protein n=1 Tax=Streptomyces sp. MS19 TaxID=3385972 RepID=UPI0039A1F105